MALTDHLLNSLRSFVNNYQAVMWRLRECSLNDEQLGIALGVSGNAIRNRRAKPSLWKLSDVQRLADHFSLPTTACTQLNQLLHELPDRLRTMPAAERRRIERMMAIKVPQLETYNRSDWPVRHLLRIQQALVDSSQ
ncbi:hypothetical protein [Spirosoma sp. 209]|nr:hypothetical protein [Spirosoma sp. 209]